MNEPEQAATETGASADATKKSPSATAPRPMLLTWSLDSMTRRPVGRWIVEAADPRAGDRCVNLVRAL